MLRPLILTLSFLTLAACGHPAPSLQPFVPAGNTVRSQATPAAPAAIVRAVTAKYASTHTMPTHVGSRTTTTSLSEVTIQPNGVADVVGYTGRLTVAWTAHRFDGPDQRGSTAYLVVGTYDLGTDRLNETKRTQIQ